MSFSDCIFKVKSTTSQYHPFAKSKLEELTNKIILDSIHDTMRAKGFSKKIIDATYVEYIDLNTGDIGIISDYTSEGGADISKFREEGTPDHKIEPAPGKVLSWISNGKRFFSKGHWVKGFPEERVMKKTVNQKLKQIQKVWDKEYEKYLRDGIYGS